MFCSKCGKGITEFIETDVDRAHEWQNHFVSTVKKLAAELNHTEIHYYSNVLRDEEIHMISQDLGPTAVASCVMLLAFTVVCGLTSDCVVTKPYVGIAALFSAALGIAAGMGVGASLSLVFAPTCSSVPFLCLGEYESICARYS
jgi:hypothetical protein